MDELIEFIDLPKGVSYNSKTGRFEARITMDRKTSRLGAFATAAEAHDAYEAADKARTIASLENRIAKLTAPKPRPAPVAPTDKRAPVFGDGRDKALVMLEIIEDRLAEPDDGERLIRLCADVADKMSMICDTVDLNTFREACEAEDPDLLARLPSDFRVGNVMQSVKIQNSYGFWRTERREGMAPLVVFTEQREPIFEPLEDSPARSAA